MKYLMLISSLLLIFFIAPHAHAQQVSTSFDTWNNAIGLVGSVRTLDGIINRIVPFLIVVAGVILLIMLIMGGFQMLTSGASPDSAEAGKKKITTAIMGFFVVITAYWLIQILEVVFGVNILN